MATRRNDSFNTAADKNKAKNLGKFLHKALDFFAGELDALTFIEQGADITLRDQDGNTPLIKAAMTGKELALQALIDKGADLHEKDKKGVSALAHAVLRGNRKAAEILLNNGARLATPEIVDMALSFGGKDIHAPVDCLRFVAKMQDKSVIAVKFGPKLAK